MQTSHAALVLLWFVRSVPLFHWSHLAKPADDGLRTHRPFATLPPPTYLHAQAASTHAVRVPPGAMLLVVRVSAPIALLARLRTPGRARKLETAQRALRGSI